MGLGTRTTRAQTTANGANASTPRAAHAPNATRVSKPPRSNRQNLARLEIVVTPSQQKPNPKSNRQFLRPSRPLPWIQLIHEALQLQLTGHSRPPHAPAVFTRPASDFAFPGTPPLPPAQAWGFSPLNLPLLLTFRVPHPSRPWKGGSRCRCCCCCRCCCRCCRRSRLASICHPDRAPFATRDPGDYALDTEHRGLSK
jgi:hypothetical protein